MPEIGEIARIVHYLHQHLVGKTLAMVKAQHDENVFGKVGTSAAEFEKALTGKKVLDARQQGKYFWLVMSSPPHPLFHFGMAGWWKIRDHETAYYKPTKPPTEPTAWPPKYWKFALGTSSSSDLSLTEHAFVDFRRFGRIRLIDCPASEMRHVSPLAENGPDPVVDRDVLTEDWLVRKLQSKHVPVKALLLDQGNISGIGNWVGDELLYDAKIHPEQYSDTLTAAQMSQLHRSIRYVCSTAVELKAESERFPETWLFKYRWGKGKKDDPKMLPNGERIKFLTVGGRTSAIVPSVQRKTGEVAKDVADDEAEEKKPTRKKKGKKTGESEEEAEEADGAEVGEKPSGKRKKKSQEKTRIEDESKPSRSTKKRAVQEEEEDVAAAKPSGRQQPASDLSTDQLLERKKAKVTSPEKKPSKRQKAAAKQEPASVKREPKEEPNVGRRRSARVSGGAAAK